MKKILSMILVLALALSLVACGNTAPTDAPSVPQQSEPANDPTAGFDAPAPVAEEVKGVTIPEFAIMLNGVKVDNVMMAAYPTYSVTANSVNSSGTASTTTYVGFAMTDVLAAAGLTENYIWLEATADDGYAIEITGEIVTASTTLLAITKNGEQFKTAPWFAPCSSQTTGDYLKNMVSILVNTTEAKPEGIDNTMVEEQPAETPEEVPSDAAAAPELSDKTDKVTFADFCFKVNGQEVTNATLEGQRIYKVSVNVTNKKGETSEVGYTGYKLIDVLAALGITDYTTVKVIANDGYETELTAEQAASEYTLIAIEKDKEMGEDGTIWVSPCLETSSSAYCKLVVEIIAE